MNTKSNSESITIGRLQNFPITFFAAALGFAGFTLAIQKSRELLNVPSLISTILMVLTIGIYTFIWILYLAKAVVHTDDVKKELYHPVKMNFFPLIAKVILVLSIIFLSRNMIVSEYLWIAGSVLQLGASLLIISSWFYHSHFKIEHLTPGWFIPIVGSLIIPIAGVRHGYEEISWFFFAIGLIFWIALFIIVLYRMIFHPPIVQKLLPTLFILFAPPAIAFISYVKLTGGLDSFGRILFYFSLFLFLLIFSRIKIFVKIKFYLSWWAYSFPLAAVTLSSILMYDLTKTVFYRDLAIFQLILLTGAILMLSWLTIAGIIRKNICIEED